MKKIVYLILIFVVTLLFSCSKDSFASGVDPIIGNWSVVSSTTFENGVPQENDLTSCEKLTNFQFRVDETATLELSLGEEGAPCTLVNTFGTWENKGDGVYTITDDDGGSSDIILPFGSNTLTLVLLADDEESPLLTFTRT